MRPLTVLAIACLCLTSLAAAKEVTIHGFVTDVKSATSFTIDDYIITRDQKITLDLSAPEGDKTPPAFTPEDIRVGTELEVKGELDEASGELKAKSVKVFFDNTHRIRRTALLEQLPALSQKESSWEGTIHADGQTIAVAPTTIVTIKPNISEQKDQHGNKDKEKYKDENLEGVKLTSLDSLNLDTFLHYEGMRQPDGTIKADKVEFEHGEVENGEAKMLKHLEPKVKDPDYFAPAPGELKMHWKKYKIVPSKEAQDYISKLGESLIPAHQKEMPADDPLKISFRFYLVQAKVFNAAAYPNGVVVVHSADFDILQNEAQLAFVMAHEISHAVEKHAWEIHQYHRKELLALRLSGAFIPFGGGIATGLTASAIQNRYIRTLENQADRVGLEWMLAAGYDIREAPASWKALAIKKDDDVDVNPFWSTHDNYTTRRSYLMSELKNNYSTVDYSKLKKDSDEFHRVAALVKEAEASQKKRPSSSPAQ